VGCCEAVQRGPADVVMPGLVVPRLGVAMKVLHVVSGRSLAESGLRGFLRHTGHAADVVTIYGEQPAATRDFSLLTAWRLWRILRRHDYDVVHTHGAGSLCYRLLARWAGTKVIVDTVHPAGQAAVPRRGADATIAVSQAAAQWLADRGVRYRKVAVIPQGVDFDAFAFDPVGRARVRAEFGVAEDAVVLGTVGRLHADKRCHLLIEAAAPLLGPRVKLLIAGDGREQAALSALAARHGVTAHVLLAGQRADVPAVLSALDVFVTAAAEETFGQPVLEALGNGLPTLYTACPALEGIEIDQARQVLGDADSLRHAIRGELKDPRPRAEVPVLRERFGMETVADRIDTLYTRLWSRRTGRPTGVDSRRAADFRPAETMPVSL
jgi:glycosyltransferase involved in cell wall biosynthesis